MGWGQFPAKTKRLGGETPVTGARHEALAVQKETPQAGELTPHHYPPCPDRLPNPDTPLPASCLAFCQGCDEHWTISCMSRQSFKERALRSSAAPLPPVTLFPLPSSFHSRAGSSGWAVWKAGAQCLCAADTAWGHHLPFCSVTKARSATASTPASLSEERRILRPLALLLQTPIFLMSEDQWGILTALMQKSETEAERDL